MIKDSFQSNNLILKSESNTSLYIGDKTAEVYGLKQDICNNGHTIIRFGNCERKDLIDYFSFDLVTHKLFTYDYYSESFRNKMNFPSGDDSLRGEYSCELVDNNKVK